MQYPSAVEVLQWPNGLRTVGGGTRNAIALNRAWDEYPSFDPAECPFCRDPTREQSVFPVEHGWRVLPNPFTPFAYHRLVIPESCWPLQKLRVLGGRTEIERALEIIVQTIRFEKWEDVRAGIHVGSLAGQNIGHAHYHVVRPIETPSFSEVGTHLRTTYDPNLTLSETDMLTVSVGGIRAGQVLLVANGEPRTCTVDNLQHLADRLSWVIELGAKKFLSAQGNPPQFMVGLSFVQDRFDWGYYMPILSQVGFPDYFSMMEGWPIVLPWAHALTAAHLKAVERE